MTETKREKIERLTLEFVKQHQPCTKTAVIDHVDKLGEGSIKTIHFVIIECVKRGKLKVIKKRPNSQTHNLIINTDDEFIAISLQLAEIENLIFKMRIPTSKFTTRTDQTIKGGLDLFWYYQASLDRMLRVLLIRASKLTGPEEDSQKLYARIVKSMITLEFQFWHPDHGGMMNIFKHFHYEDQPTPTVKEMGVNAKIVRNLVDLTENFIKRFSGDSDSKLI